MKAPFFTVLIDTYNHGEFVEDAVSSVLAQDFPAEKREILVVDDGSTDDTEERLRKFGEKIRYLRKENGGQASAFNVGFEHARGEVIALLDADDVWLSQKLKRIYEEFQSHPGTGMVYHRTHLWNGVADISEDTYFIPISGRVPENRRALLEYPMVAASCLAFRREALQKLLPVPESLRFQADAYLTALVIFVATVEAVPEFLGKYRLHGRNLFQTNAERTSRSQIEGRMATRGALLREIENWLQKHGQETGSRNIRAYLKQWAKAQESDGFALRAPGRWKYFRHLLDFPRTYGEIMTPRHKAYSYLRAFAALFLGYHHLHVLDEVRVKRKQLFHSSMKKSEAAEKGKALAAKGGNEPGSDAGLRNFWGGNLPRSFVSVLIDTYNHERFIEQAIVSVLEQEFPAAEREIIVVDDGSTDRTPEIVRKFEPRVRLLRKENGGQASAFNVGIPECKGEIVAFLDGDDWWAPGKLQAVTDAMTNDMSIGLLGHGITEVFSDGREHTELLREVPRFRLDSVEGARTFRLRKSFLGTSRMTFRSEVLRKIGAVPETLRIEADEYLFTLAGLYSDVLILRESLTFYRVHESNAFHISGWNTLALRKKQQVLNALAESLRKKLAEHKLPVPVVSVVAESIETEASLIRLWIDNGFPWETIRTELRNYRIMHENASTTDWAFKGLTLIPACIMSSRRYYSLRQSLVQNSTYRKARERWLPFPQPAHVDRYRTTRP